MQQYKRMLTAKDKKDLLFQFYLVGFFDILGQRESLRKITQLPSDEKENLQFIDLIKKSYGKVFSIRKAFQTYFDAAINQPPNVSLVSPENREEFLASQKVNIHSYGLSDSFIIAVPLMSEDENCTAINGVNSAFVAVGGIGLMALSTGIVVRAGLDVGIASLIDEKEIYGPALERAFKLESELAEYPRFLVGKELITYLNWVENQKPKTRLGLCAKNMAKFCREMIVQDTDGRFMLDFLGNPVRDLLKDAYGDSDAKDTAKVAYNFVVSQYQKYIEQSDDRLAACYFKLLSYFQSRKSVWGIEPVRVK